MTTVIVERMTTTHPPVFFALALALALAACAAHRPAPAVVKPHSEPGATAVKPRIETAAPAAKPHMEAIQVVHPENEERGKAQIRQSLARSERDVPAYSDLGYYLDVLQGRLNQSIGSRMTIARGPDRLTIDLARQLKFAEDGAQLSPSDRDALVPLINVLAEYQATLVSVKANAGDVDPQAVRLANLRAQALAQYLLESGIAPKHIVIVSAQPDGGVKEPAGVAVVLEPILRTTGDK